VGRLQTPRQLDASCSTCPRAGVVYKYVYLGGGVVVGWGGGVLNLPVALVWPQSRPSCDEYKQEGNQTGKQGRVVTTSPWKRCHSNPNMVCAPRSNGSEFLHLSLDPTGLQRPPRTIMIIINIFDTFVNSAGLTRVCHEASFMKGSATIKSSRQTPIINTKEVFLAEHQQHHPHQDPWAPKGGRSLCYSLLYLIMAVQCTRCRLEPRFESNGQTMTRRFIM